RAADRGVHLRADVGENDAADVLRDGDRTPVGDLVDRASRPLLRVGSRAAVDQRPELLADEAHHALADRFLTPELVAEGAMVAGCQSTSNSAAEGPRCSTPSRRQPERTHLPTERPVADDRSVVVDPSRLVQEPARIRRDELVEIPHQPTAPDEGMVDDIP